MAAMPEGDTLRRVADRLGPMLVGYRLDRVELNLRRRPSLEVSVREVRAQGKHLLIDLESGEALRIHLGMWGTWHRYALGERFKKPPSRASVLLECDGAVLVCFNAREVECFALRGPGNRALGTLGPDLLAPSIDLDEVVSRARETVPGDRPIVDLLLDQRVACGIGNIYKNETLFLEGVVPTQRWDRLGDQRVRRLFQRARQLMQQNLGSGRRVTTAKGMPSPHWVYSRSGSSCLKCEAVIQYARLGQGRRDTYWCPSCQPRVVETGRSGASNV